MTIGLFAEVIHSQEVIGPLHRLGRSGVHGRTATNRLVIPAKAGIQPSHSDAGASLPARASAEPLSRRVPVSLGPGLRRDDVWSWVQS